MRIAVVTGSFLPAVGGAEYVVHNLANGWADQGHEVRVFNVLSNRAAHAEARYDVSRYRYLRGSSLVKGAMHWFPFSQYASRDLKRRLVAYDPAVISAHFGYPVGVWLSRIKPLPRFLVTCHGRELTKFAWGTRQRYGTDGVLASALNRSGGAVAISSHARMLMEELGVRSDNIVDIPNGVEVARFSQVVSCDVRARLGVPKEALMVLSVGREHTQKDYERGLRAFGRVAADFPEARYVLLGHGTSVWGELVSELGLEGRVVLCEGLQDEWLVGAYQQADVFFSCSVWEMMPLVVLEAMAAGRPLLVTDVSGSQDLVDDGVNGLMVQAGDVEAMAGALGRLLGDGTLREQFSQANRQRANQYSWSRICERYLEAARR